MWDGPALSGVERGPRPPSVGTVRSGWQRPVSRENQAIVEEEVRDRAKNNGGCVATR
jgi:hypothetical protein